MERPEATGDDGGREVTLDGAVEARGLVFRYGQSEAPVLMGASFKVEPGEFVAVVGPSGAGKTTLLKLLCGMERAQGGQVMMGGRPLSHWDLRTLRRQTGVVLQEDTLLRGSIAENVALFDEQVDMDAVRAACAQAGIAGEIEAMPMGYESQVGDMGSTLSGGQKQRVLIARALYREPRLLLLDEATSHLDTANEACVLEAIGGLGVTRIVIAHRPETIAAADRVLVVQGGRVVQQPKATAPLLETAETAREKPALPQVAAGSDFTGFGALVG